MGFFALLRPGELFGLTEPDVALPNALSLGASFAVLKIRQPKNARQLGVQQYAEVRHPDAINWLTWLTCRRRKMGGPLWGSTASRFRRMFRAVCDDLRIRDLRLLPASLRAGGASWLVATGTDISKIRFQGRRSHKPRTLHPGSTISANFLVNTGPDGRPVAVFVAKVRVSFDFACLLSSSNPNKPPGCELCA